MSIYKEGYNVLSQIDAASKRIFQDAADFGAPTMKGDALWVGVGQLVHTYKTGGSKTLDERLVGGTKRIKVNIRLVDEWAAADDRKSIPEATEYYKVEYTMCGKGACQGYDGYITIEKIDKP
jgi:hypothetical protein